MLSPKKNLNLTHNPLVKTMRPGRYVLLDAVELFGPDILTTYSAEQQHGSFYYRSRPIPDEDGHIYLTALQSDRDEICDREGNRWKIPSGLLAIMHVSTLHDDKLDDNLERMILWAFEQGRADLPGYFEFEEPTDFVTYDHGLLVLGNHRTEDTCSKNAVVISLRSSSDKFAPYLPNSQRSTEVH